MATARPPGGTSTGAAQASLTVSTAQLSQAASVISRFAAQTNTTLTGISKGTKAAEKSIESMGDSLKSLAGKVGIAYGAQQITRYVVQADALATTYRRQTVAATHLAGSQGKLNELMAAYSAATGGAVDKATSLAQVTRLTAVGFADSGEELTRIVTIARGAALAMGSSQEYILGQMQLALANQSTMRLDQIGVGVEEFQARLKRVKSETSGLSTEVAFSTALLEIMSEKFGALAKSTEAQATGAEKAAKGWKDMRLAFGEFSGGAVGGFMGGVAAQLDLMSQGFQDAKRDIDAATRAWNNWTGRGADSGGGKSGLPGWMTADPLGDFLRDYSFSGDITGGNRPGGVPFFNKNYNAPALDPRRIGGLRPVAPAAAGPRFDEPQTAAIREWASGVQAIERSANAARLSAVESYESSRAEAVRSYGLSIVREEQDFALSRLRAAQNLARSITRVASDAAEREADWTEKNGERIADLRKDADERVAEQEASYAKSRERAARRSRDTLLNAAARLDASAVFEEQKRFATEQQDASEDHKKTLDREAKQLQERIAQENEAHQERIDDARKADARRIEEMRESLAEAQRIEDEDRAIRKQRAAEDHAANLARMDTAHADRIAQINRQAAEERTAHDLAFQEQMIRLGVENEKYKEVMDARERIAIKAAERFFDAIEKRMEESRERATGTKGVLGPTRTEYATGGYVGRTAPALLHAGEWILTAAQTAAAMQGPGGAPGGDSRSIVVEAGAIQVYGAPGQSEEKIGQIVEARFEVILDRLAA